MRMNHASWVNRALNRAVLLMSCVALVSGCGDDGMSMPRGADAGDGGSPPVDGGGEPMDGGGMMDGGRDASVMSDAQSSLPKGTVRGRVFDATSLNAVASATVRAPDGNTTETDSEGRFELDVATGERVVLRIDHTGHARGIEPVRVLEGETSYLEARLAAVDATGSFDAMEGGSLAGSNGASATFPAGALRTASGDMVTGDVEVSLAALDPTDVNELRAFPGDFSASREDGSEGILETFVPMDISVRQGEEELQLADGMGAEVTFPVFTGDAPTTITLWSLDPETGSWVEEGTAVRVTDQNGRRVYRARIGHMSWWNCDAFINERTCVRGCVTHDGDPVPGAYIRVRGVDFRNEGGGSTDSNGCFAEDTKAGARLALQAEADVGISEQMFVTASETLMQASDDPDACQDLGDIELMPRDQGSGGCPSGTTLCGSWCVDTMIDSQHCGGCDMPCGGGEVEGGGGSGPYGTSCVEGECSCKNGEMVCNNACTDTSTDRNNCGSCGNACPTGEECVSGSCEAIVCADGLTRCGNICVDTMTNNNHCGSCDDYCGGADGGAGELSCRGGECLCSDGLSKCVDGSWTYCADLTSDRNNCGTCGKSCATGTECVDESCEPIMCSDPTPDLCGNDCVDQQSDTAHCGGCNQQCYSASGGDGGANTGTVLCESGSCACESGYTDCNPGDDFSLDCRDLQTDMRNCGSCGNECVTGQTCTGGECVTIECPDGETLCGSECVDLQASTSHCGACGNACPGGSSYASGNTEATQCTTGVCECPDGTTACIGSQGEGVGLICTSDTADCVEVPAASCGDMNGDWAVDQCGTQTQYAIQQLGCAFTSSGGGSVGWFSGSSTVELTDRYQTTMCTATLSGDSISGTCDPNGSNCALSASRPACSGSEILCGATCTDTSTSVYDCGFCDNYCGSSGTCNAGTCEQAVQ